VPPPPVPQKKPSKWVWVIVGVAVIAVVGSLTDDKKNTEATPEAKPVASGSPAPAVVQPQATPPQPSYATTTAPPSQPQDEWVSAVGKIEAGVTVYFRNDPNSQPDAWFTVIEPYVDGPDGPQMLVKYAASGDTEYLDRRATMRSPAAHNGQLVIRRSEAR
jgi:hypothetical protein